jgi:hypothetical protein
LCLVIVHPKGLEEDEKQVNEKGTVQSENPAEFSGFEKRQFFQSHSGQIDLALFCCKNIG